MSYKVAELSTDCKTLRMCSAIYSNGTISLGVVVKTPMTKVRVDDSYRDAMCRRLKDARASAGYTQATFAERLGLEEKTYAKYESRSLLPHNLIGPVCRLLDLDVYFFLDGVGRDAERRKPIRIK